MIWFCMWLYTRHCGYILQCVVICSGVQSAAVNVICELARKNPKNYLSLAPLFFKLMTSSTNNWVLIKIIKLVRTLHLCGYICGGVVIFGRMWLYAHKVSIIKVLPYYYYELCSHHNFHTPNSYLSVNLVEYFKWPVGHVKH